MEGVHGEKLRSGLSLSGHERDLIALRQGGEDWLVVSGCSGADSIRDARGGATLADLDNDGDMDIIRRPSSGFEGEPKLMVYRNNIGQDHGFLRVSLRGDASTSGLDAWGATVRIKTSQGTLTKVKTTGTGFLSQWDPRLAFGLGDDPEVSEIEVVWPSGQRQRFEQRLAANTAILLVEGSPEIEVQREWRGQLPDPESATDRTLRSLRVSKGSAPPDLSLTALDGTPRSLREALPSSGVTLINFWATWCGSCATEMPELQALHETGLNLIGVSVDSPADQARVRPFLKRLGVTYPVFLAGDAAPAQVFLGAPELPLSLLVDEQGVVIDAFSGWNLATQRRMAEALERHRGGAGP